MKCIKNDELLSAYIDQEVTEDEKAFVEKHILECNECAKKIEAMSFFKNAIADDNKDIKFNHKTKNKIYSRIFKYLITMFLLTIVIFSVISITGGYIQLLFLDKLPWFVKSIFFAGVVFVLVGLLILLYDIFVDIIKIIYKK